MTKTYVEVKELNNFVTRDHNNLEQDMVLLQSADDHVFAVLSSFLEQEAGALHSPYGDYELVFMHDDDDEWFVTNTGEIVTRSNVEYTFPYDDDEEEYGPTFGNVNIFPSGT